VTGNVRVRPWLHSSGNDANVYAENCVWLGAGERIRTAGLPFTRSTAACTERASCTDDAGHGTDYTHRAGTIWRAVPRTVPRPKLPRPLILLLCVTPPSPAYVSPSELDGHGDRRFTDRCHAQSGLQCCRAQASARRRARIAGSPGRWPCRPWGQGLPDAEAGPGARSVIHFAIWAPAGDDDEP
jgi:hypothetical protein